MIIFFVSFLEYNSVAKVNILARLKKWEFITVVIPKAFNALCCKGFVSVEINLNIYKVLSYTSTGSTNLVDEFSNLTPMQVQLMSQI